MSNNVKELTLTKVVPANCVAIAPHPRTSDGGSRGVRRLQGRVRRLFLSERGGIARRPPGAGVVLLLHPEAVAGMADGGEGTT